MTHSHLPPPPPAPLFLLVYLCSSVQFESGYSSHPPNKCLYINTGDAFAISYWLVMCYLQCCASADDPSPKIKIPSVHFAAFSTDWVTTSPPRQYIQPGGSQIFNQLNQFKKSLKLAHYAPRIRVLISTSYRSVPGSFHCSGWSTAGDCPGPASAAICQRTDLTTLPLWREINKIHKRDLWLEQTPTLT